MNNYDVLLKKVSKSYNLFDQSIGTLSECFEIVKADDMNELELKRMDIFLKDIEVDCKKIINLLIKVVDRKFNEGLDLVEKKANEVERSEIRKKLLSK